MHLSDPLIRKEYEFVFEGPDIWKPQEFDSQSFIQETLDSIRKKGEPFDGMLATEDYPVCIMGSIIAEKLGLRFPSTASVFICQNKYYSRTVQASFIPEATPGFALIDPETEYSGEEIPLEFPFFIKPVKSYLSMHAKAVRNASELNSALAAARTKLPQFTRPFDELLATYPVEGFAFVPGRMMLAEEMLRGEQVSIEGYVYDGEITILGIFDSLMHPGTLSFKSFETPSSLPGHAQERVRSIAEKAVRASGLESTVFNVEMMYIREDDSAKIIEINPRMAGQFVDLVDKVYGRNMYRIQLDLCLGRKPDPEGKKPKHKVGASFPLRLFKDMKVTRAPRLSEIADIHRQFPDTLIHVLVAEGSRLSDYPQDSDSFRYCLVNTAAGSREELHEKFERIKGMLRFEFVY
jgi:biotin carboxylase